MYEVKTNFLCGDWTNCWFECSDNSEKKMLFATREEAQAEIEEYIVDRRDGFLAGDINDFNEEDERENLRIFLV